MKKYDHKTIEEKWRKAWEERGTYRARLFGEGDKDGAKPKFYNLMMFPYPSAEGLHVGNMYAFTGADFYGRFKAMQGYNVFEPIGLDGFGIHSENYAIKIGKHPKEQAKVSEANFYRQLRMIGNRFSWEQRLETYDPEYYRWTQWLFVQMYKNGLAYRKKARVNWCPSCKTVLADEQVEDGVCERCKTPTEKRENEQWFFRITEYADRLLKNIEKIKWPEKIKAAQRNWIGRKEGINITYRIKGSEKTITCFTTTPVNFGATFIVIAPEHEIAGESEPPEVREYVEKALNKTEQQRLEEGREKSGVFTGLYAINHVTGEEIPVWVADFVLKDVGTGAVQGCPGHDMRDFEFASKFGLPIKRVVVGPDGDTSPIVRKEQVIQAGQPGKMINSDFLNGLEYGAAMRKTMDYFEDKGWGKRVVSYHLRDWLISRQRYWGPPIPMVYCDECEWNPVPEEELPVLLPDIQDYQPTGDGKSPLSKAPRDWLETKCPECGGKARRETDVSDTFLDSAWYFLRYPSLDTKDQPFSQEALKNWLPVDAYIGGAEHAVLHLLYARFVWMALADWGFLPERLGDEPFPFLFSHGLIIKDGAKMSKSRGNVVNPDEYIEKYGADTLRLYLMFLGPYDMGGDFRDTGIAGTAKFLRRVWSLVNEYRDVVLVSEDDSRQLLSKLHLTVKRVGEEMGKLKFNTAIAAIMELVNTMYGKVPGAKRGGGRPKCAEWEEALAKLVLMLAPMAPYAAEEMWESLGGEYSVHEEAWPQYEASLTIADKVMIAVQVNGKLRGTVEVARGDVGDEEKVRGLALANPKIKKWVEAGVKKTIFVPGRVVNFLI